MSWKAVPQRARHFAKPNNLRGSERGNAAVEFALILGFVAIPLLIGSIVFGFNLTRAIQASEICRSAGHMFAYGVDFTNPQNRALLAKIALPVGVTSDGGPGSIVLSRVQLITDADCKASGLGACANTGTYVFTSFLVFGSKSAQLAVTKLGNPPSNFLPGGQQIKIGDYMNNMSLRATAMAGLLGQSAQQVADYTSGGTEQSAFISEMTLSPQIVTTAFSNTGSYARSIF